MIPNEYADVPIVSPEFPNRKSGEFAYYIDMFGNYHSVSISEIDHTIYEEYQRPDRDRKDFWPVLFSKIFFLDVSDKAREQEEPALCYFDVFKQKTAFVNYAETYAPQHAYVYTNYILHHRALPCGNARACFECNFRSSHSNYVFHSILGAEPYCLYVSTSKYLSLQDTPFFTKTPSIEMSSTSKTSVVSQKHDWRAMELHHWIAVEQSRKNPHTPKQLALVLGELMFECSDLEVRECIAQILAQLNREDLKNKQQRLLVAQERQRLLKRMSEEDKPVDYQRFIHDMSQFATIAKASVMF